ncbi:MAG TPA: hypothetical protein VN605_05870 [Thermoanaerobaculia bacterium]|nr:hypothetical protein [Thermoanaerobaculia bacterium]
MSALDRCGAAAIAGLSAIALLYVGYCQVNMNAPWLYRDQAFLLYLSVPIAFLGAAVSHLASGAATALRRVSTWVFYAAAVVAIVQLMRFFASAYAMSHAF